MNSAILNTKHHLLQRWPLLLLMVVFEIAFLFLLPMAVVPVFQTIAIEQAELNALLQQGVGEFVQTNEDAALAAIHDQAVRQFEIIQRGIVKILLYLLAYWLVFHGIIWWLAHRIAGNRHGWDFIWRFGLTTIVGFAVMVGAIGGMVSLAAYQFNSAVPLIGQFGMNLLTGIVALILLYFLLVAYCVLGKGFWKKCYVASIKKITTTGLAYVVAIFLVYVFGKLLIWLFSQHRMLALAYAFVILLPLVAKLRVFLIEVVKTT